MKVKALRKSFNMTRMITAPPSESKDKYPAFVVPDDMKDELWSFLTLVLPHAQIYVEAPSYSGDDEYLTLQVQDVNRNWDAIVFQYGAFPSIYSNKINNVTSSTWLADVDLLEYYFNGKDTKD